MSSLSIPLANFRGLDYIIPFHPSSQPFTDVHCPDTKQYIFLVRWLHFHQTRARSCVHVPLPFAPLNVQRTTTESNWFSFTFRYGYCLLLAYTPIPYLVPQSNHSFCCLDCEKNRISSLLHSPLFLFFFHCLYIYEYNLNTV